MLLGSLTFRFCLRRSTGQWTSELKIGVRGQGALEIAAFRPAVNEYTQTTSGTTTMDDILKEVS